MYGFRVQEKSPKLIGCFGFFKSKSEFMSLLNTGYVCGIPVIKSSVYKEMPSVYFDGFDWCPMRGSKRSISLRINDNRKHAYAYRVAYLVGKRIALTGKKSAALRGKSTTLFDSYSPSFERAVISEIKRGYLDHANLGDKRYEEFLFVELRGKYNGMTRVYFVAGRGKPVELMYDLMRLDEEIEKNV